MSSGGEQVFRIGPVGARPSAASGIDSWDDKFYGTLLQILITHFSDCFTSIQITYENHGSISITPMHGRMGQHIEIVTLEPGEQLEAVEGHYKASPRDDERYITSLSLRTNRAKYGPFGPQVGQTFSINWKSGPGTSFAGFHGRSCNRFLRDIGIHVRVKSGAYAKLEQ